MDVHILPLCLSLIFCHALHFQYIVVIEHVCLVGSIYKTLQASDCGRQWILSRWWL